MSDIKQICERGKAAKYIMNGLDTQTKNKALLKVAETIVADMDEILAANDIDMKNAAEKNVKASLMDRLKLTVDRVNAIAEGIRQVADLDDPTGLVLEERVLPNGLELKKVSVPLGCIGIIYESRPNVTPDAFALCFKAGNSVVLKGGSDAINSNLAIAGSIRKALASVGIEPDVIQVIDSTDRNDTTTFMKMKDYIDVLIPRGGAGLIRNVVANATIPVIETGTGNCHVFVDETADMQMAADIIFNAKTQRTGVCNACESIVVHKNIAEAFLPVMKERLSVKDVEIRADESARAILTDSKIATEEDYGTEYLDLILSVKTVNDIDEAIAHINKYSTHHSECIITADTANAEKFLKEIDSACVYVNASTRFSDGFEFGLGAEIGISTQRLHARGPMGLRELTTYKYNVTGNGQVRS
ncbi:MAG: glutamate-5-semialdehyde dehydrogenase [Lachnospiraceae bacterium]|nr:glutamate-5-semialdehyde dehydrogenase [Lachnospiraceae bacterium]